MRRLLTAAQMKAVDAAAAGQGMPASVLMENAGARLAQVALDHAGPQGRFLVLCGTGNNGGDGLVAARKLAVAGRLVLVELIGDSDKLTLETARNLQALSASGLSAATISPDLPVGTGDVVLDCLFGTGLSRAPEGAFAEAIGRMSTWRASGAKVISADLPSGLQSDSGVPFAPCVTADATVAFGFAKLGQALEPGAWRSGFTTIADIGIPRSAESVLTEPIAYLLEETDVQRRIPPRKPDSHKGTFGHVLVVAGSRGKTGAAALAGMAALRTGAGLVTVATRREALDGVLQHAPELMGIELPNQGPLGPGDLNALLDAADGKQAVVIGPGIARGDDTGKLIGALLEELSIPCVLDADALNAIAGKLEVLQRAKGDLLLTPHPGEMARLLGKTTTEINADRVGAARSLSTSRQVIVVLKGARTVIAREDGAVFINPTGNPGMATGGSGDVLSGMCAALLGQGLSSEDAAVTAVYAHGAAGDWAVRARGRLGLVATDLLDALGQVWVRWER